MAWASEEIPIPYVRPDGRKANYWPDVLVEMATGEILLIEIKPYDETVPPQKPRSKSPKAIESYNRKMMTYLTNMAKWEAAKKFCEREGMQFVVMTENELHELGIRGVKRR